MPAPTASTSQTVASLTDDGSAVELDDGTIYGSGSADFSDWSSGDEVSVNDVGDTMTDLSSGEQASVTELGSEGDHGAYAGTGQTLQGVSADGALLVLDDGSVWTVAPGDQPTAAGWSDGDNITVSGNGDQLVDTDQQQTVTAGYVGTP